MKAIPLTAEIRNVTGKKVKKLRQAGKLPVTVYGKDVKSESLTVDTKEFLKVYDQAGETGLVDLKYGKESKPTLITDVQIHALSRLPLHVQFHAVKLTEKIKANVPLELIGESPKVVSGEGLLLQTLNEVEVEALPTDLPEKITLDVTALTEIGQQITVAELPKISGVEILTDHTEVVVKLDAAISEEAKKEAEAATAKAAEAAATPTEGAATEAPKVETPKEEKKE